MLRKVKVEVSRAKLEKNFFLVIPDIRRAMREANKQDEYHHLWNRVSKVKTYEEGMKIIRKYVKFVFIEDKGATI